ncbi:hypothetical protein [Streptomyces lincolnensis]|uniref:hypothetical protein n=1 Tax=Streptomyces lincolnensis TaxID=1915 RepID=UPI0008356B19|nr:hypothetical protein [Streptomyces lincolnensis]QMV04545.1 hypothetical protein GJU35_01975 [Streptomyces lincolnensis]QMV11780.1 hypothetical protein GJU35_42945 [Streptomyces lincolnensis]
MADWITIGVSAAAVSCPVPALSGSAVVVDGAPDHARVVVCAPDAWIVIGDDEVVPPPPSPTATPRAAVPSVEPAPVAVPSRRPEPAPPPRRAPDRPVALRAPAPPPEPAASGAAPGPVEERPEVLPRPAPPAFRWVPRAHYVGGPQRPAPGGLSTTFTMVVVTMPAVLAAAALRPGSRRRSGRG